jgi:hypothetical protein
MDQVGICNLALQELGARSTITSLDENSTESIALNNQYDQALDSTLTGIRWNFARAQAPLTLIADATQNQTVPTPWLYEYAYPSDCVQARYIMPVFYNVPGNTSGGATTPTFTGPPIPWLVSSDFDNNQNRITVILTNQPQAILVYTARVSNPNNFSADFVSAFSKVLASRICLQLTGDKTLKQVLIKDANQALIEAQVSNGNEGLTIIDSIPDWMRVRGYASDFAYPNGGGFWGYTPTLTLIS